ncbi:MAG TPA: AmmeMemoRadiSam system protein B [Candidatus Krumholzibacteria bacterium]|nr:AmmeMemoRadiSam system protein B [Candidatus Krumholzibacteria bacterium]
MDRSLNIRPPAVAGQFYPADPDRLARAVDRMLAPFPARPDDDVRALLAPHAGHRYSGALAAESFAAVRGRAFDAVVLIGPSHREAFDFTSVYDGDGLATPLGVLPVDRGRADSLTTADGAIRRSSRGHAPARGGGEHAIEVLLPFLQRVLGNVPVIPVIMGAQDPVACAILADALAPLCGPKTLLVISSDLSHFHRYDDAVTLDSVFCERFATGDADELQRALASGRCEACGGGPAVSVLRALTLTGGMRATILRRINSGDVTGHHDSVVGYAAGLIRAREAA